MDKSDGKRRETFDGGSEGVLRSMTCVAPRDLRSSVFNLATTGRPSPDYSDRR